MIEASPLIFNLQSPGARPPRTPAFSHARTHHSCDFNRLSFDLLDEWIAQELPRKPQPDARLLELLPCDLQLVHEIGIRLRLARPSRAVF